LSREEQRPRARRAHARRTRAAAGGLHTALVLKRALPQSPSLSNALVRRRLLGLAMPQLGSYARRTACSRRSLHSSLTVCRNRILFEPSELQRSDDGSLSTLLRSGDSRTVHLESVLRAEAGQSVRVGAVDGVRATALLTRSADAWCLSWQHAEHDTRPCEPPALDLLLALPRPKALRRLLRSVAALGVGALFIVNASKVERAYFDSDASKPAAVRAELLLGLEQAAGDTRLPPVILSKRLPPIIDAALGLRSWEGIGDGHSDAASPYAWLVKDASHLPPASTVLLLAHPSPGDSGVAAALDRLEFRPGERILLAVGPEGGWTPYEVSLLMGEQPRHAASSDECRRREMVSLGERTFDTYTATVALLAAAREAMGAW